MRLSKIINQFNKDQKLYSITIDVRLGYSVCRIFKKDTKKNILKVYKNINIDIDIPETSTGNVKQLGVTRYFHLKTDQYYINLYYY